MGSEEVVMVKEELLDNKSKPRRRRGGIRTLPFILGQLSLSIHFHFHSHYYVDSAIYLLAFCFLRVM